MELRDIRLFDKDNPGITPEILKEISRQTTDGSDKYDTLVISHEPINLKEKLACQKLAPHPPKPNVNAEQEEIIDDDYDSDDSAS